MSIITLFISVKHIRFFMEGIGALRLLDTHLHLLIMIFGVYKICGLCIHTHTHTHKCTKSWLFILLTAVWLYWEQRYSLNFIWFLLSLKLSSISNRPIVKIISTHTVTSSLLCFKSPLRFHIKQAVRRTQVFYSNRASRYHGYAK